MNVMKYITDNLQDLAKRVYADLSDVNSIPSVDEVAKVLSFMLEKKVVVHSGIFKYEDAISST